MRSPAWLLLLAAAGCFRSSTPATPSGPAGPAPTLAWVDNGFDTTRLPAASADGKVALIGIQDDDGGRGNPNYRFELRNRSDVKDGEHGVLTVEEADKMFDASGKTAELDQRIAAANKWLDEQNAARRLVPLTKLELETTEDIASTFRASRGGITVEWRQNKLKITQGGQTLVERATPATWLAEDRKIPGEDLVCSNPPYLGGAAVSVEHKLAVLRINYSGTDTCWEPNDQHHVVAW